MKGFSREELEARNDLVSVLKERIESIPDGTPGIPKQSGGWTAAASTTAVRIDTHSGIHQLRDACCEPYCWL